MEKKSFHQILLSVFKMYDTVNLEDNFLYILSGYQTIIIHSKYVILFVLCLILTNSLFSTIFIRWFKGKLFR